jgi:exodeoxyribonuclease VII large subunit
MTSQLRQRREALGALSAQLELLNPQRTLERGYAIVSNAKGKVLHSPGQIRPRDTIVVRLAEGSAEVGVASVQDLLE